MIPFDDEKSRQYLDNLLSKYKAIRRTREHVFREYNQDKYGELLKIDTNSVAVLRQHNYAGIDNLVISKGRCLYEFSLNETLNLFDKTISKMLQEYPSPNYCELGCGFGFNLTLVPKESKAFGGELTDSGVMLAKRCGLDVHKFDFYDASTYSLIKPNTTIFTVHAIEQMPSAVHFIENLRIHKDKVNWVVHLEPGALRKNNSLAKFQNFYTLLNDYNSDLFYLLTNDDEIELHHFESDVIGINPLNPAHCFAWRFTQGK